MRFVTGHLFPLGSDVKVVPLAFSICLLAYVLMAAGIVLPFSLPLWSSLPHFLWPCCYPATGEEPQVRTTRSQQATRLQLVFGKGRGSGLPVPVWACASLSDSEGGWKLRRGRYCLVLENYIGRKTCPKLGF